MCFLIQILLIFRLYCCAFLFVLLIISLQIKCSHVCIVNFVFLVFIILTRLYENSINKMIYRYLHAWCFIGNTSFFNTHMKQRITHCIYDMIQRCGWLIKHTRFFVISYVVVFRSSIKILTLQESIPTWETMRLSRFTIAYYTILHISPKY